MRYISGIVSILIWIISFSIIYGQETELVPTSAVDDYAYYGMNVGIINHILFVKSSSAVYIFKRVGDSWIELDTIHQFARSASGFSDDFVLIGIQGADDAQGRVNIYKRTGESWNYETYLQPIDEIDYEQFGATMECDDDIVIIGAYFRDNQDIRRKLLFVYRYDGMNWIQKGSIIMPVINGRGSYDSGISLSGDYLAMGCAGADIPEFNSGAAFIYKRESNEWHLQSTLTPSDAALGDWFGLKIAISGDYVAVGAPYSYGKNYNTGAVYIFHREGENWVEQTKIIDEEGEPSDNFGYSVAMKDDLLIIGALREGDNVIQYGAAFIYKLIDGEWVKAAKITLSERTEWDYFGYKVDISSDYALISALFGDSNGEDKGAVFVYDLSEILDVTGEGENR